VCICVYAHSAEARRTHCQASVHTQSADAKSWQSCFQNGTKRWCKVLTVLPLIRQYCFQKVQSADAKSWRYFFQSNDIASKKVQSACWCMNETESLSNRCKYAQHWIKVLDGIAFKQVQNAREGYLRPKMGILFACCMLLGQVAITCRFQAQLCYVDSNAAKLETRKLRPPASAAAAWTLLFEQPYAVSDQPAHQTEWCLVFSSPYNK